MANQDDAGTDQVTEVANDEKPSLGDLASQFQIMVEKPDPASEYEHLFNRLGQNGDGKILLAELKQYCNTIGAKLLAEDAEEVVATLARNGDGLLGFYEILSLEEGGKGEDKENELKDAFKLYGREWDDDFGSFNPKVFGNRNALRRMRKVRGNLLPISHKDEVLERKGVKAFLYFAFRHVRGMSPKEHQFLLGLCGGVLGYLKSASTPFDFQQFGKTTKTLHSLVSFGEASSAFSPDIAHIAFLILSYSFTWMLVLPMRSPGVQITLMLLLMGAPFFYFPELVHKASISGIDVACGGSFQLPLIWFTTLWAFAACLVFGLVAFPMVYLIVRFIYGKN